MLYRVYTKYQESENTIAICKDKKIAEKYVKYLEEENKRIQNAFYSMRRAFTFFEIDNILEDEDIVNVMNSNSSKK